MNEIVKRTWTAHDGCLVFDVAINRDPSVPSTATVRCKSGEEKMVAVAEARSARFEFKFDSGCFVRGTLHLSRSVDSIGVFADIRFGLAGQPGDTHFEGLMVDCPSRASSS